MLTDYESQRDRLAEQERDRLLQRTHQLEERKRQSMTPQLSAEAAPNKKLKPAGSTAAPIARPVIKVIKPAEPVYPCVLCASSSMDGLLQCTAVPSNVIGKSRDETKRWFAHEMCALYIPEVRQLLSLN